MTPTEQWLMSLLSAISHIALQFSVACCLVPAIAFAVLSWALADKPLVKRDSASPDRATHK